MKFHTFRNGQKIFPLVVLCGKEVAEQHLVLNHIAFTTLFKEHPEVCCQVCKSTLDKNFSGKPLPLSPDQLYEKKTRPILEKYAKMSPSACRGVIVIQPSTRKKKRWMFVAMVAGGQLNKEQHFDKYQDCNDSVTDAILELSETTGIPKGEFIIKKFLDI